MDSGRWGPLGATWKTGYQRKELCSTQTSLELGILSPYLLTDSLGAARSCLHGMAATLCTSVPLLVLFTDPFFIPSVGLYVVLGFYSPILFILM